MSGALFDGFGAPIGNETTILFDGPGGVAVTYPCCRLLMSVEDGPGDAPCWGKSRFTVDLAYAVPKEGDAVPEAHLAHLVAVADCDGRIAFFGRSEAAIEAAVGQVLRMSGGGVV